MAGIQHDDAVFAAVSDMKKYESDEKHNSSSELSHELDGIHDGLEFPTEEERVTLRRVSDTIPWNAYCTQPSMLITGIFFDSVNL